MSVFKIKLSNSPITLMSYIISVCVIIIIGLFIVIMALIPLTGKFSMINYDEEGHASVKNYKAIGNTVNPFVVKTFLNFFVRQHDFDGATKLEEHLTNVSKYLSAPLFAIYKETYFTEKNLAKILQSGASTTIYLDLSNASFRQDGDTYKGDIVFKKKIEEPGTEPRILKVRHEFELKSLGEVSNDNPYGLIVNDYNEIFLGTDVQ